MTVEFGPEQEKIIREQIASGHFRSVEELLTTALSRLPQHRSNPNAVARMLEFSERNSVKLPAGETVKDLLHEGHRY